MLRRIAGKRTLNDSTSAILNQPSLEPAESPQTTVVSAEDEGPTAVEANKTNLPVPTTEEDPSRDDENQSSQFRLQEELHFRLV